MKWFDNMVERAMDRVRSRLSSQPTRQGALHGSSLSDVLNGRVCAMVYSIDNGFILVNPDQTSGATKFVHAKDAVEVGEVIARQLTLQRMGVLQGSSIKAQVAAQQAKNTVSVPLTNYNNPSF